MKRTPVAVVAALLASVVHAGCAATLRVHHRDLAAPAAQVLVDGAPVGLVSPGDELSVDIERGVHEVDVRATDGRRRWLATPLRVFVDDRAELSLHAPDERGEEP